MTSPQEQVSPATIQPLPPGPDGESPIMDIRSDPLGFVGNLARQYGDIACYQSPGWFAVLVNHPRFIQQVLLDNFRNYGKAGTPDLMMLKPMLGCGLLTSDGDTWKRQRQMLQPAFNRGSIERYAAEMVAATVDMLDSWEARDTGTTLDVVEEMAALTLRIAARAFFSYDVSAESGRFAKAVEVLNETMGHPGLSGGDTASRFQQALGVIQGTVRQVVLQRLADGVSSSDDALGLMIEEMGIAEGIDALMSSELMDQIITLLLAGHETTAKALSWTLYLLSQHTDEAARVLAEIDSVLGDACPTAADIERMPYTWAVLQEAMRIYPPIWLMSRRAKADDTIGGYRIPAGTLVVFSPFLVHRRPDLWPDPEAFRPQRFLGCSAAMDAREFSYLPFSGGPRHCVGKHFAALEMRLVLPMILRRFSLRLRENHPVEPQALVTLRPRYGLPMSVSARRT